jgi:hypothetical protein
MEKGRQQGAKGQERAHQEHSFAAVGRILHELYGRCTGSRS